MAKKDNNNKTEDNKDQSAQAAQPAKQVTIAAQYIKDISFENPRAPHSLAAQQQRPNIAVNVDVKAEPANKEQGLYEVTLITSVHAKSGEDVLFHVELSYAGLFAITGLTDQELEQTLLIYCPNIMFPFARRIVADVTRDGGFPPLLLDVIDFAQIYIRRQQLAAQKAANA